MWNSTGPSNRQVILPQARITLHIPCYITYQKASKSLLNIFNRIWNNEIAIPTEWKDYLVIPILKHGKPKEEENSYRPISASCILKTFERMLKNRLEHWLEHHTKPPLTIWVQKE
ncbi:hypothetical protein JTB14_014565 [Gonioctena quinquepunctata]|nr:hypothetical protein JTB14_014565 [Gonioctena quinquepunctata]